MFMAQKTVQEYFGTLESRIGYQLLLGGTRHFGYYENTWWPFPIGRALRAMEAKLFEELDLKEGATVLDAGTGFGHVAVYMAKRGLIVKGVDIVDWHIKEARKYVKSQHAEDLVEMFDMSYEHLSFEAASFDGAYTMETLTHANDPDLAMSEFFRVLKPGGHLVLHEYEHDIKDRQTSGWKALARLSDLAHTPAMLHFHYSAIRGKLEKAGFVDVHVQDLTENVAPMFHFFVILAFIPYLVIRLLGLQVFFVNAVSAVECQLFIRPGLKYLAVKARKPG
jgi:sterol 24-C-methyltransferase